MSTSAGSPCVEAERPRRRAGVGQADGRRDHAADRGAADGPGTALSVEVERVFRAEHGRAVAVLVRVFGDIDVAEEAVQDAFAAAVERWPADGVPPSPAGWIITTARRRAIDKLRREASREDRHAQAVLLQAQQSGAVEEVGPVQDDRLRLIFTCCHPSLGMPAQVALTLRLLGGLSTAEIARAFLVGEPTMAQRLVRAKGKIRDAPHPLPRAARGRPARAPAGGAGGRLPDLQPGLPVAGRSSPRRRSGSGGVLVELMPDEPEALGLLALMLLVHSRRDARLAGGELVLLADQDRSLWDAAMIDEGQALVRRCLRRDAPGPYQLQAAINAVHSEGETDWWQVLDALRPAAVVHADAGGRTAPRRRCGRGPRSGECPGPRRCAGPRAVSPVPRRARGPAAPARPRRGGARRLRAGDRPAPASPSARSSPLALPAFAGHRDHVAPRRLGHVAVHDVREPVGAAR